MCGRLQVTYAANDDLLVTAGYDQSVKIWDCKSRSTEAIQVMKAFKASGGKRVTRPGATDSVLHVHAATRRRSTPHCG